MPTKPGLRNGLPRDQRENVRSRARASTLTVAADRGERTRQDSAMQGSEKHTANERSYLRDLQPLQQTVHCYDCKPIAAAGKMRNMRLKRSER